MATQTSESSLGVSETDHEFAMRESEIGYYEDLYGRLWFDLDAVRCHRPRLLDGIASDEWRDDTWWSPREDHPLASLLRPQDASFFACWIRTEVSTGLAHASECLMRRTRTLLYIFRFLHLTPEQALFIRSHP